jgi:hypothetical protein
VLSAFSFAQKFAVEVLYGMRLLHGGFYGAPPAFVVVAVASVFAFAHASAQAMAKNQTQLQQQKHVQPQPLDVRYCWTPVGALKV